MSLTAVTLKPSAGFCIKSVTLEPCSYLPKGQTPAQTTSKNLLEPTAAPLEIPIGRKVFVNICWDANVPPPPEGSEEAIQKAMDGEDADKADPEGWFAPVVVSEGREDTDKAGKPSLVFDCVYNSSLKRRSLADPKFKIFLIELALQRIEAQTPLVLSRNIGTPNIASKGKLERRTVNIPSTMTSNDKKGKQPSRAEARKPLIEEISPNSPISTSVPQKGILKPSLPKPDVSTSSGPQRPSWTWSKKDERIEVVVSLPLLKHPTQTTPTLDVEEHRFIINASPVYLPLDVNLGVSDAELIAKAGSQQSVMSLSTSQLDGASSSESQFDTLFGLKRQRPFDIDGAHAEWRVQEGKLVITL